jgi:NADH:ubiquinone reductase (H+-translocating)
MDDTCRSQPGSQGSASTEKKHVVILGGGFGGIYAALRLEKILRRHDNCEVTLITRENYFLFTPLLAEVAVGDLELDTIINSVLMIGCELPLASGSHPLRDLRMAGAPFAARKQ